MTGDQQADVDTFIQTINNYQPQKLKVKEVSNTEVLVTFKVDDGERGLADWAFFGTWKGNTYEWAFQKKGMPVN